ncbi:hypothetical protein [Sphingomonas sp.]|uniref:hypothetical protein n=1 Tax=Sphingomonas sp. TaxID=28214 RepID=UPI0025F66240|nr:hypothetical protein [Sphingomonas sp.]MBV9529037.1 hypothetical protein [Sphingomonas sp.]
MRALMPIAAATVLAACSQAASPPGADVANLLAGRVPGPPQSCITTDAAENLHAVDAQTIAYGTGRTIYINHLAAACPAIGPLNTIIVEPGLPGQYCRNDRIRGNEPGSIIPGPSCNLNEWVPYRLP